MPSVIDATLAKVTAALGAAAQVTIAPAGMVAIIDMAIANAMLAGKPIVSYSINGRSVSIALGEARALREYYHNLAKDDASGGIVVQGSVFG